MRASRIMTLAAALVSLVLWTGATAYAAPPDPHTIGATTLSGIQLNGEPGTSFVVQPGEGLTVRASWSDDNGTCQTCDDFVSVAFAGQTVAGCIEEGGEYGRELEGEVDVGPAPAKAGTYDIVASFEEVYECGAFWNAAASSSYPVLIEVTVAGPHWYGDGERIDEGHAEKLTTSGLLTLAPENVPGVTCKAKDKETVENPAGGGAGSGTVTAFTLSGCKEAVKGALCAKGEKLGVTASGLPWTSELLIGPPIREQLTNVELAIDCTKGTTKKVHDALNGSLTPEVSDNVLVFGSGAGELAESLGGKAIVIGEDNLKGPSKDPIITAQTP